MKYYVTFLSKEIIPIIIPNYLQDILSGGDKHDKATVRIGWNLCVE